MKTKEINFIYLFTLFLFVFICFVVVVGVSVCVFELHVVDFPWKQWLVLRGMMKGSVSRVVVVVGLRKVAPLCLRQSRLPILLYTSSFGYVFISTQKFNYSVAGGSSDWSCSKCMCSLYFCRVDFIQKYS